MAELERFTVEERTEYGVRNWTGAVVVQDGHGTPWASPHRELAEEEVARAEGRKLIERRVFVMTGEWQPVTFTVGLPEPVTHEHAGRTYPGTTCHECQPKQPERFCPACGQPTPDGYTREELQG